MSLNTFIFDTWNVVINYQSSNVINKILAYSCLPVEEARLRIAQLDDSHIFRLGKVTWKEYFEKLSELIDLRGLTFADFQKIWNSEFTPNSLFVDIIRRHIQWKLVLVTDMNELHYSHLLEMYPDIMALFDHIFTSFQLGVSKKDPRFLEIVTSRLNVEPSQCLYVDDKPVLVENAIKAWFNGITYTAIESFRQQLVDLLLKF